MWLEQKLTTCLEVSSELSRRHTLTDIYIHPPKDGTGQGGAGGEGAECVRPGGHRQTRTGPVGPPGLFTQWTRRAAGQGSKVILHPGANRQDTCKHTHLLWVTRRVQQDVSLISFRLNKLCFTGAASWLAAVTDRKVKSVQLHRPAANQHCSCWREFPPKFQPEQILAI